MFTFPSIDSVKKSENRLSCFIRCNVFTASLKESEFDQLCYFTEIKILSQCKSKRIHIGKENRLYTCINKILKNYHWLMSKKGFTNKIIVIMLFYREV